MCVLLGVQRWKTEQVEHDVPLPLNAKNRWCTMIHPHILIRIIWRRGFSEETDLDRLPMVPDSPHRRIGSVSSATGCHWSLGWWMFKQIANNLWTDMDTNLHSVSACREKDTVLTIINMWKTNTFIAVLHKVTYDCWQSCMVTCNLNSRCMARRWVFVVDKKGWHSMLR